MDWRRSAYGKLASSPLWQPHPNSLRPMAANNLLLGTKYSTTFASGFQTMTQTASALAYEFLKPQFTPRAPMGCLQYFTQPSGIIESFNFGQYLNNMDYSICVQRQADTCRVVFTSSDYDWSLNGVGVSASSSGVGDQDCARDYLLIPGASRTGDGFTYDRYCGGRLHFYRGQSLSAPVVVKTSGPIVLRFHSDAHFEGTNNGGFRLQYDQSAQDCFQHAPEEAGSLSSQQLLAATLSDSRPLSDGVMGQQPVLYASQQQLDLSAHQFDGHSDLLSSAAANAPNGSSSSSSSSNSYAGASAGNSLNQQQQIDPNGQNIRRNDHTTNDNYDDTSNQYVSWATKSNNMQIQDGSVLKYGPLAATGGGGGGGGGGLLSLANLTKAFQLITARSSRTS